MAGFLNPFAGDEQPGAGSGSSGTSLPDRAVLLRRVLLARSLMAQLLRRDSVLLRVCSWLGSDCGNDLASATRRRCWERGESEALSHSAG
jgi:hypothetical protein